MIAPSYKTKDSYIACDNNNIYKEPCTSDRLILPNYSRACLIKKSLSFKESIVSQTQEILCELNDNPQNTHLLEDERGSSSLNQLCTSLSCPSSLCFDATRSWYRDSEFQNNLDHHVHHKTRGVWPFCPVDVCSRCQNTALTLNNRGACLCDSVTPCHHQAVFGTSNVWPSDDGNGEPSMILHEGYR